LFISKSFKELFFIAIFSKADAKVRTFFELPKLFRKNFQKDFLKWKFLFRSFVFSISITAASLSIAGAKVELFSLPAKSMKHFFANFLHPFT
jgi:hypothetical protein